MGYHYVTKKTPPIAQGFNVVKIIQEFARRLLNDHK